MFEDAIASGNVVSKLNSELKRNKKRKSRSSWFFRGRCPKQVRWEASPLASSILQTCWLFLVSIVASTRKNSRPVHSTRFMLCGSTRGCYSFC